MMMMFGENARKVTAFTALLCVSLTMCTVDSASGSQVLTGLQQEIKQQKSSESILQEMETAVASAATGNGIVSTAIFYDRKRNDRLREKIRKDKSPIEEAPVPAGTCISCKENPVVAKDDYEKQSHQGKKNAEFCAEQRAKETYSSFSPKWEQPDWTPNQQQYCRSCIQKRKKRWTAHNCLISIAPVVGLIILAAEGGIGEGAQTGGIIFACVFLWLLGLHCWFKRAHGFDVNSNQSNLGFLMLFGVGFATMGVTLLKASSESILNGWGYVAGLVCFGFAFLFALRRCFIWCSEPERYI